MYQCLNVGMIYAYHYIPVCGTGKHGYDCSETCGQCRDSAGCNSVTGDCETTTCDKGWKGLPVCKTGMHNLYNIDINIWFKCLSLH